MDILHLSDLHVTDENHTLATLWTGVERVLGPERKFDVVVISGDLTQSASLAEYAELRKFLEGPRFRSRLRQPHSSRVVLVPGNHDVYWSHPADVPVQLSALDPGALERFKKELLVYRRSPERSRLRLNLGGLGHTDFTTIEPDSSRYRERFKNCQDFFSDFYREAGANVRGFDLVGAPGGDWSAHVFAEERIAFFGFNSCDRNDAKWAGASIDKQAMEAAIDFKMRNCQDMLCVAVWHHGLSGERGKADFLTLEEVARFEEAGFKVGFHGHVHSGTAYRLLSTQFVIISAGSLAAGGSERPESVGQQFSTVELLPTRATIEVYERRQPTQHYVGPEHRRRIHLHAPAESSAADASHVREHIRTTYVDEMGIANIHVELTGAVLNGNQPLAVLEQPFCNYEYDREATIDRERRVPIEMMVLPDGRPAFIVNVASTGSPTLKTSTLKWSYRLSNAVALSVTELELLENRRRWYKQLDPEFDVRPHTVRFDCERLILRLVFSPKSQAGISRSLAWVEAKKDNFEQVGWVRDTAEEDRCRMVLVRPDDNPTASAYMTELQVDAPLVGHRYGICFRPSRSVAKFDLSAEKLATRMLRVARQSFEMSNLSRTLSYVVGGTLAAELGGQLPDQTFARTDTGDTRVLDLTGSWMGTIWDHAARRLFPVFGEFPLDAWACRFACGNGVAGHAFRMSGSAAWLRGRGGSDLIYEDEIEPRGPGMPSGRRREYAWVICIPLYLGPRGPSLGVVCLAGEDEDASPLTHELQIQAIGLTQPVVPEIVRKRQLRLETAVNLAFWTVLAEGSPGLGLTPADHEFALRLVEESAERAEEAGINQTG